jgi:hypothetical protein
MVAGLRHAAVPVTSVVTMARAISARIIIAPNASRMFAAVRPPGTNLSGRHREHVTSGAR